MTTTKKVFFGSLFDFTDIAAEEVLDNFRGQFSDPDTVPFVSYDRTSRIFSCEIEKHDHSITSLFNAQIDAYVTLHGRRPNEPLDSDRLAPIDGTVVRNEMRSSRPREPELNIFFEVDDSSEDDTGNATDNRQDVTYWKPSCGDTSILTLDAAAEIADETRTFFIAETAAQRVKLVNGNLNLTLEKLFRMEEVMTLSGQHQTKIASRVNGNLLLLLSHPETTIKAMRPVPPLCGFERIIIDHAQLPLCGRLMLAELRVWREHSWSKPVNLDLEGVSITSHLGPSKRFSKGKLLIFGDPKNAEPRTVSNENSQVSGDVHRPGSPTKFLGQKDTERVEEWRGNVDPNAAPTLPPPEPAPEHPKLTGRRRVAKDSDDSDDGAKRKNASAGAQDLSKVSQAQSTQSRGALVTECAPDTSNQAVPNYPEGRDHLSNEPSNKSSKSRDEDVSAPDPKCSPKPAHEALNFGSRNAYDPVVDEPMDEKSQSTSKTSSSGNHNNKTRQLNVTFDRTNRASPHLSPAGKSLSLRQSYPATQSRFGNAEHGLKFREARDDWRSNDTKHGHREKRSDSSASPRSDPTQPAVPADPSKLAHGGAERHHVKDDDRGNPQKLRSHRHRDLIDVSAEQAQLKEPVPPPGFDYRSVYLTGDNDRLASTNDKRSPDQDAVMKGASASNMIVPSNPSASTDAFHASLGFTPQMTVPKRNMGYLKDQALARLKAQMDSVSGEEVEDVAETQPSRRNRKQRDDEHSSRKFHKTMSQKMAKPGKSKKNGGNKQESKAERAERIAKAKAEAYGDTSSAKAISIDSQPTTQRKTATVDMTTKKRQLMKRNQVMGDMHQDVLAESLSQEIGHGLVEKLRPILQATRAFKGTVTVEVQFGQALILKNGRVDESRLYKPKDWTNLLDTKSNTNVEVTFTNVITTNGHDIDRMLEIKADTSRSKLWDEDSPGLTSTKFEFTCQDKAGCEFMFILDQDGDHQLVQSPSVVGQIALHAPGQIWDACAVVSGTARMLRPSADVLAGVELFKASLYMPGGDRAVIYYRLPSNNAFTIKAIVMKRVMMHDCLLPAHENMQLRMTEVKALAHSSHPTDRKLFRSYESSYEVMVGEDRIHYEVAIVDKTIEDIFKANPDIKMGELVAVDPSNESIINYAQALGLVKTALYMLERIDWAGAHNIGTLRRVTDNTTDQRATVVNTLPPNVNRNLAIPMGATAPTVAQAPNTYQSVQSRAGGNATTANMTSLPEPMFRQIPGVRANTAAELFQDYASGDYFYLGQGGARIPVVNDQLESMRFDGMGAILPGDSASQVVASNKKVDGVAAKGKATACDDKPAGFW